MKRIGILHYKVGGTDGVSLEIEKWQQVLEEMGHAVFLCAGDLGQAEGTCIPEMFHHTLEAEKLYAETFVALQLDEAQYEQALTRLAATIGRQLRQFVAEKQIDFLIPHNVWSVAVNPAVALAVAEVVRAHELPVLAQHHDFYWERIDGVALTCATAVALADKFLPPRDPLIRHAVINSLAQHELLARKGIATTVIPNVFDFEAPPWPVDDFNRDLRRGLGLHENDIVLLQATRIVRRKGIELAIDFARALNEPARRARLEAHDLYDGRAFGPENRIVLVLAGYAQDDLGGLYIEALRRKISEAGVDALFIEDIVGNERIENGAKKQYALWDTYTMADFVTYPSLWEGWGNQLLEALRADLPFLLFEYPVYQADIKDKGFKAVSLGGKLSGTDTLGLVQVAPEEIDSAADEAVLLLTNGRLRTSVVAHNREAARRHYSLDALRGYLDRLINDS